MPTLAERLAPRLYGVLIHPGDDSTEPFPMVSPLAGLQTATMPPGMAEDIAEQAGLPSTDFARIWLEAVIHLIETEGNGMFVDNDKRAAELAELKHWQAIAEPKANEMKHLDATCGVEAGRAMSRDLHTPRVKLPCEILVHDCKRGKR